jgi:DNA-binding GntR family transcriptional regulator
MKKVEFHSKNKLVYDLLRKALINGDYQPGERLIIDQLAVELGVSQIPIREALRQLEADGFITIEPYSGATVTPLNVDFILEVFALLENIEVICSRAACRSMTDSELEQLAAFIQHMDTSVDNPDKWSQENKELHLFVCDCARSALAKKLMQNVLDHWDRLRLHYLKDVFGGRIRDAQQEHHLILEAFRSHNLDEVERVVRQHNQNALTSYLSHLRSAGYINATLERF